LLLVKIIIFAPTYNTTQEPQTEIEALLARAVHSPQPDRRNHSTIQSSTGAGYFYLLLCWELNPAKEVVIDLVKVSTYS
jgi:hypothetical protein